MDVRGTNFSKSWAELTKVSDRIYRRGFDGERLLISARHEIRGLACHHFGEGRYLVVAGDKRGFWYAAEFGFDDAEGPVARCLTLRPPPLPSDRNDRVVDDVAIVPWGECGRFGVVLATRGNGAWISRLERVEAELREAASDERELELFQLPESSGRKVRSMIYDSPSQTLLAVARHGDRNELLCWSLAGAEPELLRREEFPYALTCIAIDRADEKNEEDLLYVATSRFELLKFRRPGPATSFLVTAAELRSKVEGKDKDFVWEGRLSPILRMRPISDVGYNDLESGIWRRTYPENRGVFAITLRHLLLIYDVPGDSARSHARLVVGESKNLDLTILNFPEKESDRKPYCGWHGVAVSTLKGTVRIFRPSGIRRPESGGFGLFRRDTPETRWPTLLISGYKDLKEAVLPDRVYAMIALSPPAGQGHEMGMIFGLGNHEVRWHRFRFRWRLREEARRIARQLVDESPSIDRLLEIAQDIALSSVYWKENRKDLIQDSDLRRDKYTLIELLPRLWRRFETEAHWQGFYLLVWDILARRTPRFVAIGVIQALRRVQRKLPEKFKGDKLLRRQAELEDNIVKIRKFVLDPGHFSQKRTCFLELANTQDPDLTDERAIYRAILLSRRHDPVFLIDFDAERTGLLGEVITFTPLPTVGGSGEFWKVADPGEIRFVASNYAGELWLLDGKGRARCVLGEPAPAELRQVRAAHAHCEALFLSFSDGSLRYLAWRQLPPTAEEKHSLGELQFEVAEGIGENQVHVTAFASVPPRETGRREPSLLWGDRQGRIWLLGNDKPLFVPTEAGGSQPDPQALLQLAWFEAEWQGERRQPYVLAGTAGGRLLLFEWRSEEGPTLVCRSFHQLGSDPISALLVTGPNSRHVIVARYDTAVGLKLLGEPETPRLGLVWAFRTDDTVRSIQPILPEYARDSNNPPYRVLVGSHDAHLYALDLEGRHLETYSFREDPLRSEPGEDRSGFKVGLFVASPPRPEDSDAVVLRVYVCAFENRYAGLRLIDRPKMLKRFDDEERNSLSGADTVELLESEEHELRLTRWRAYHVDEGHLRHRFIRQSRRYPGTEPTRVLDAISWLLEACDASYEPTGELTALLRRLFQEPFNSEMSQNPQGLKAMLADPELYRRAIVLLQECGKRWDTLNSVANQRVLLFWIRSCLRAIADRETLRSWIAVGEELALQGEPLAKPEILVRHFLEHSHRLIRYKTLQYLERMVFGWPGVTREGPLFTFGEVGPGDLDWLINALFHCLAQRPEKLTRRQEPSPTVLQIGRLLCLMMRDGHVDPLYLTYRIQRHAIDHAMYRILEDQWEALGCVTRCEGDLDLGHVLRCARRLDESLASGEPLEKIVCHLEVLIARSWPSRRGSDEIYLQQAPLYFRAILPLLKVADLKDIQQLAGFTELLPKEGEVFDYCPSYEHLAKLRPLLDAVRIYYAKKYKDQWVNPVMTHLQFEDFDRVRKEWRYWKSRVGGLLAAEPLMLARRESLLLQRLLEHWEEILITREQDQALLQDFQNTLRQHSFKTVDQVYNFDPEKVRQVREDKKLAMIALSNLFTRLLLLAEPSLGVFLYRWKDENEEEVIRGRWFRDDSSAPPVLLDLSVDHPSWLPGAWLEPETFSRLDETTLFEGRRLGEDPSRIWTIEAIAGTPDEKGMLACYLFAWDRHGNTAGLSRFEAQRLAWAVPLQALVYRRAAVEQVELKGRIFSIIAHNLGSPVYLLRSDLKMLSDRRLEGIDKEEKRLEKYLQLLRQARQMDGIIDSILSLSEREIKLQIANVSVARLTHEVVRTARREAKPRNVQIEYPEPTSAEVERTKIETDEPKVYDILLNLLTNAVKYSPINERIVVTVTRGNKGVNVKVTDRGPGIPVDERSMIYEPFFRGTSAHNTASGLGLGLYTARLYAELLQGRLNHQNEPEQGSSFTLFLPSHRQEG